MYIIDMFIDFKKDNKILEHGIIKQYTGYLLFTSAICLGKLY